MKVLLVNGSPHLKGTTDAALGVVIDVLNKEGIETELISLSNVNIADCQGCGYCHNSGKCIINDLVNEIGQKASTYDGFIFATPVYYAHPTARILAFLNRLFYAYGKTFAYKPAASLAVARRAGLETSLDTINKHFAINQMPIVSSSYWNGGFGTNKDEIIFDKEGINTFTNLAKNMAWILKVIESGKKEGINHPDNEIIRMNFIRK